MGPSSTLRRKTEVPHSPAPPLTTRQPPLIGREKPVAGNHSGAAHPSITHQRVWHRLTDEAPVMEFLMQQLSRRYVLPAVSAARALAAASPARAASTAPLANGDISGAVTDSANGEPLQ